MGSSWSSRQAGATRTASTCTPKRIRGRFRYNVDGYRATKGLGNGKFLRSTSFYVGDCYWAIRYYPNGCRELDRGYTSVYLEFRLRGVQVKAFFELSLVDQTTGLPTSVYRVAHEPIDFRSDIRSTWGPHKFKRNSELESSVYVRNDRLTIECAIDIVEARFDEPKTRALPEIDVPPSNMSEHFARQLEEKELADVTFEVGGEAFTAHKMVLAIRSPVFRAELYGPIKEKDMRCITIEEMEPAVFKALLHFIYTDSLPAMDDLNRDDEREMIGHLLVAADRYDVDRLKLICESLLCKSLGVQTVATTLALADQHQCNKLKDACVQFILSSSKKDAIVASQGYKDLTTNCPSVIADVWEKMAGIPKI